MKKYYAEREQILPSIEFNSIKKAFLHIYNQFLQDGYFAKERFIWAYQDPELFLFQKLGMWDIWPFEQKIETYDEATLFSVIEFLYEAVFNERITEISEDFKNGQIRYGNQINDILRFYNGGYKLSKDGKIQKLSPPGFEGLTEVDIETNDPERIDKRVKYAISKFSLYNSSIWDKKEAVRTLADVLEYLKKIIKKEGIYLPTDNDRMLFNIINKELFNIINNFDIRHLNKDQLTGYDEVWYDWMFYTFLASIHVELRFKDEKFGLKITHAE